MRTQFQVTTNVVARLLDAGLIGAAWLASFWFRFYVPLIDVSKGFPPFSRYAALTPLMVVLWGAIFEGHGIYAPQRTVRRVSPIGALLRAHGLALLCFIALTCVFTEFRYSRLVVAFFGVLGGAAVVLGRVALHAVLRGLRRNGFQASRVVLVGAGQSLGELADRISESGELGLDILGVLLPDAANCSLPPNLPVLGNLGDVGRVVHETGAHKVLIALPRQQWSELDGILEQIKDDTIDIQIVPDLQDYATIGCAVDEFEGLPIVSLNGSPLMGWRAAVKRLTDIGLSSIALIAGAPVFLLVASAVKATSRGPVFFQQERMGLDGRTFKMFKFRSMRVDAESSTGAVWAKQGDDRRTPIGAFLRATSLDEIPQFWNVFLGHMSLVGPRPERPVFVNQFRHEISHYMLRHRVKAGVTGWAQVNGWRGNTSLDQRIRCDLYYIRHWSYLFDLKILLLTVWKGFVNKNAY